MCVGVFVFVSSKIKIMLFHNYNGRLQSRSIFSNNKTVRVWVKSPLSIGNGLLLL